MTQEFEKHPPYKKKGRGERKGLHKGTNRKITMAGSPKTEVFERRGETRIGLAWGKKGG